MSEANPDSVSQSQPKPTRSVFVIMPFRMALDRNKTDLDAFFEDNLKVPIEADSTLTCHYRVVRSDNTLDITEKIVRDIFEADIVICDLSGNTPNPNVMYELGMRFALGHKPVILIREEHAGNQDVFDIRGLYTHSYSSKRYKELTNHIIEKLRKFEAGEEVYESPVLKVLSKEPQITELLLKRQVRGILRSIAEGFYACQELLRRDICIALLKWHAEETGDSPCEAPKQGWKGIVDFLTELGAKLPPRFYEIVNFIPPPVPGLLGYLTYHPLSEVVPAALAEPFGTAMHNFYFHYFAGAVLQKAPCHQNYSQFVHELGLLHDAATMLSEYLGLGSESAKDIMTADILRQLGVPIHTTA